MLFGGLVQNIMSGLWADLTFYLFNLAFSVTVNLLIFSSDEGEGKEELEELFVMENGYEGDLPSPVIPSSLLEEQVR